MRRVLALLLPLALLGGTLAQASPAVAKAKAKSKKTVRCKGTQVRLTVAGKSRCVAARSFAPVTPKADRSIAVTRSLTGPRLPKVALKHGRTYTGQFSAREQVTLANYVTVAESRLRAAVLGEAAGRTDGPAVTATRAAPVARAAAGTVTFNPPQVNVTIDQASGTAQVTGRIDGSVELDGGATANVEVSVSGTVGGAAGPQGELSFEVGGTIHEKGKSTSRNVKLTLDQSATKATCPDATGRIQYLAPYKGSTGGTDVYKAGPITYGSISSDHSVSSRVNAVVTMKDDATLPKVPFVVSYDVRLSQKVKLLGIPLRNVRATAIATASGTLDAKTGAIDPGMAFNVSVTTSGMSGGDAASLKAQLTSQAQSATRSMLGELAQHMKQVEAAAQGGKCTALALSPASGAQKLGEGETAAVTGHVSAPGDGGRDVTAKVRWTVVPEAGQATLADAGANPMTMTVTGARGSPDAARIRVRAVSHTGISELVWTAAPKPPFPKAYSGPVSFQTHHQNPVNSGQYQDASGQATATYTLKSTTSFPDGSMTASYDLTALDVSSLSRVEVNGTCTASLPPYAPGVVPTSGNTLVIAVSAAGAWTYSAKAYASFGVLQGTRVCTDAPNTTATIVPVFDFFTSGPGLGDDRSMSPQGAIAGSDPTGIYSGDPNGTKGATWSLTPGG
jgi:hypothetical protein